ncbi:MAG: hypothetical protein EOO38_10960 [Cytophagaceae bacterium]|nr:MAG: hypothetical protein EOO38_10960 [Cytophagaceae bacterium]
MWSHLYGYYEIRGSAKYDVSADTEGMRTVLDSFSELKRIGLISYENAVGYPWISLSLVKSSNGNYSVSPATSSSEFNLIPVVCSKSVDGRVSTSQVDLLIRIAAMLNWELVEEETDESDEEVILYHPL